MNDPLHPAHFPLILQRVRKVRGLPQGEVAKDLGIDQSYLSSLENGRRAPPKSPEFFERLGDVLVLSQTEIDELKWSAEGFNLLPKECQAATPQQAELGVAILRSLKTLNPYQIRAMFALLDAGQLGSGRSASARSFGMAHDSS